MTSRLWWRAPTPGDLLDVAVNMRAQDGREIFAVRVGDDTPAARASLAYQLYAYRERAAWFEVMGLDGRQSPAAFLGAWAMDETGGLLAANLFATPEFPEIATALIRRIRRVVVPALLLRGTRRVECRALLDYRTTRRMIRACGAVEECILPDYGKNSESFVLCAWRRSDFDKESACVPGIAAETPDRR